MLSCIKCSCVLLYGIGCWVLFVAYCFVAIVVCWLLLVHCLLLFGVCYLFLLVVWYVSLDVVGCDIVRVWEVVGCCLLLFVGCGLALCGVR